MSWFSSIANFLGGIGSWMSSYMSKENTKARVQNDKTEKIDLFNESIKNHDLDDQRRKLK